MRNRGELSRRAYNQMASHYDQSAEGRFTSPFQAELVSLVDLKPGDRILDVACGTGTLLAQLTRRHQVNAHGIDIAENMIAVARAKYPAIEFQVGDSTSLPFPDGSFDVITVCAAFHHFGDPRRFAREAARTLASGGRIYIAEVYAPPVLREIANVFLPLSRSGDLRFYAPGAIAAILRQAGLSDAVMNREGHIQVVSAAKP